MLGLGKHQVFVDANVLYSRTQRDWLGLIYTQEEQAPYIVYWSEDVLAEVIYRLRRQHSDWDGKTITTIRDTIASTFEVGRVDAYEVVPVPGLRDPYDLHVYAAATACGADVLVTADKDFPSGGCFDVMSPDDFFVLVDDAASSVVRGAVREQVSYWGRRGDADLAGHLRRADCPRFADRVLRHLRAIALSSGTPSQEPDTD